jgi:hypothetical protein
MESFVANHNYCPSNYHSLQSVVYLCQNSYTAKCTVSINQDYLREKELVPSKFWWFSICGNIFKCTVTSTTWTHDSIRFTYVHSLWYLRQIHHFNGAFKCKLCLYITRNTKIGSFKEPQAWYLNWIHHFNGAFKCKLCLYITRNTIIGSLKSHRRGIWTVWFANNTSNLFIPVFRNPSPAML